MQLADNPITKILREKVKNQNFYNLNKFIYEENRTRDFQLCFGDLLVDFTRQPINYDIKKDLLALAKQSNILEKIKQLSKGEKINFSENRSVDHFKLRKKNRLDTNEWEKITSFINKSFNQKKFEYLVNIGIGGSDLGPLMINEALKDFHTGPEIFYVSNIDPSNIFDILKKCNPNKTLFIITSKSFSTQETMANAKLAKKWLLDSNILINDCMIAVTASVSKAIEWGFKEANIFPFSENIGGRYSLWSSVGLPIIFSVGEYNFKEFLNGANEIDDHFFNEDIERNIPIILALLRIWNRNFLNRNSHCIVPYSNRLKTLPSWAQQLEMESNGKSVDINNKDLEMPASPLIWGECGTNAQHSFFQFLHQGLEIIPIDILLPRNPSNEITHQEAKKNHESLVINAIAQAESLAIGSEDKNNKNKHFPGGRPSTVISWDKITPNSIGRLIALYENITIASGFIWNINSFDQWGVELGKNLAKKIEHNSQNEQFSPSARQFLSKQNSKQHFE